MDLTFLMLDERLARISSVSLIGRLISSEIIVLLSVVLVAPIQEILVYISTP